MVKRNKKISIVVPAYNEAKNFEKGVWNPSLAFLKKQKFPYEVIFVDDGSTDKTAELLAKFCKKEKHFSLLTIPHGGKAMAVKAGVLKATGDIILFCDFDQATPLETLTKFLKKHAAGADVVVGDRTERSGESSSAFEKFRSFVFTTMAKVVANIKVNDTQCGFKSLTHQAAQKIFTSFKVSAQPGKVVGGYMGAFDVELLFLADKFGFNIAQVKVARDDPYGSMGKYNNKWREPLMMTRDIFKIRYFDLLGKYNS